MRGRRVFTAVAPAVAAALLLPSPARADRCGDTCVVERNDCATMTSVRWLAQAQNPDGSWGDRGAGDAAQARLTGMVLLVHVGRGITPSSPALVAAERQGATYGDVLQAGLRFLLARQDASGCLAPGDPPDEDAHVWAMQALISLSGVHRAPDVKRAAAKAAGWLVSRVRREGGWGAGPEPDPLLTARAVMALASARLAGIALPDAAAKAERDALDAFDRRGDDGIADPGAAAAVLCARVAWWWPAAPDPVTAHGVERTLAAMDTAAAWRGPFRLWGPLAIHLTHDPAGDGGLPKPCADRHREFVIAAQHTEAEDPLRGTWDPDAPAPPAAAPPTPEARRRIAGLIGRLGDDRWEAREEASQQLVAEGRAAIALLEEETDHPDAEVRERVALLLQSLRDPARDNARIEATCLNAMSAAVYYRFPHYPLSLP